MHGAKRAHHTARSLGIESLETRTVLSASSLLSSSLATTMAAPDSHDLPDFQAAALHSFRVSNPVGNLARIDRANDAPLVTLLTVARQLKMATIAHRIEWVPEYAITIAIVQPNINSSIFDSYGGFDNTSPNDAEGEPPRPKIQPSSDGEGESPWQQNRTTAPSDPGFISSDPGSAQNAVHSPDSSVSLQTSSVADSQRMSGAEMNSFSERPQELRWNANSYNTLGPHFVTSVQEAVSGPGNQQAILALDPAREQLSQQGSGIESSVTNIVSSDPRQSLVSPLGDLADLGTEPTWAGVNWSGNQTITEPLSIGQAAWLSNRLNGFDVLEMISGGSLLDSPHLYNSLPVSSSAKSSWGVDRELLDLVVASHDQWKSDLDEELLDGLIDLPSPSGQVISPDDDAMAPIRKSDASPTEDDAILHEPLAATSTAQRFNAFSDEVVHREVQSAEPGKHGSEDDAEAAIGDDGMIELDASDSIADSNQAVDDGSTFGQSFADSTNGVTENVSMSMEASVGFHQTLDVASSTGDMEMSDETTVGQSGDGLPRIEAPADEPGLSQQNADQESGHLIGDAYRAILVPALFVSGTLRFEQSRDRQREEED